MRIPLYKTYRAFQELDEFSDERCEAFVKSAAKRAHRFARLGVFVVFLGLFVPGTCIGGVVTAGLTDLVFRDSDLDGLRLSAGTLMLIVGIGTPCMMGLLISDWWQRRCIRLQLQKCSCTKCGYSLLGLRPADERVTCPECGTRYTFASLGINAETLLIPADPLSMTA